MGRSFTYSEKKKFIYYRDDDRRLSIEEIIKHSKNIIYLIEVGDYVNGYRVLGIRIRNNNIEIHTSTEYACNCWIVFEEIDIKSIVTKEQFEQVEYRIGENENEHKN